MKKLVLALSILCATVAPAFAGPCAALDYQEMKDMTPDELVKETCKARVHLNTSYDEISANLSPRGGKPFPNAQENFDQCNAQIERMLRILKGKGVNGKLYELCAQQAAGQPIKVEPEAK